MHPLGIFGSLFLLVMGSIFVVGYAVLERGQETEENASPLMDTLRRIGRAAPVRPREADRLRQQLTMAGYHSPSAEPIYVGIRVAVAAIMGLVAFGITAFQRVGFSRGALVALCAALFGYMMPHKILNGRIRRRAEKLREGLPAALDLMVLGLEAGQSLETVIVETSRQLRDPFPDLCAELSMVQLEVLASMSRAQAFRNLASRNQEVEIHRLARILLDADRFGTSLAPTLRMHVHYLRIRMRQKPSEGARKVAVKMVFPLFFLIFPSILLVTLGPAVLQILSQLQPLLTSAAP
jgi:tight adherence protein C